jgi:hypothetical protein
LHILNSWTGYCLFFGEPIDQLFVMFQNTAKNNDIKI